MQQRRIEVQNLVRPPLGNRGHPGVHRLGLEHEQLPAVGALPGRVDLEPRRAVLHHRHRPGRVRVRHVGVLDEPRVERLDAREAVGPEVHGVLGHASKATLLKPPHSSPFIIIRLEFTVSDSKN